MSAFPFYLFVSTFMGRLLLTINQHFKKIIQTNIQESKPHKHVAQTCKRHPSRHIHDQFQVAMQPLLVVAVDQKLNLMENSQLQASATWIQPYANARLHVKINLTSEFRVSDYKEGNVVWDMAEMSRRGMHAKVRSTNNSSTFPAQNIVHVPKNSNDVRKIQSDDPEKNGCHDIYEGKSTKSERLFAKPEKKIDYSGGLAEVLSKSFMKQSAAKVCDAFESLISAVAALQAGPPRPMADPSVWLAGNLAPVGECPPTECLVTGKIPACLNGIYVRNGSNLRHMPAQGYHYFDGDGMLHAVKMKPDSTASYCCRFIRTNRYIHEHAAGKPLFINALGELQGHLGLARLALFTMRSMLGVVDATKGSGAANAGLAFFKGRLLAMSEDDMPYAMRFADDGDVQTVGRYDFSGKLKTAMTAHPKVDPLTGEMFSYRYNILDSPFLSYFRASPEGVKQPDVNITIPEPVLMHDFAITKNYVVFPENQMVFRLQEMLDGNSPIVCDDTKVPRVGVLPKYATDESEMQWFDVAQLNCFHYLNAWEENEEIILIGSILSPLNCMFDRPEGLYAKLTEVRLNTRTGKVRKEQICSANLDVGNFNRLYCGKKNRYVYMSISGPWPRFAGVAKIDLQAKRRVLPSVHIAAPYTARDMDRDFAEPCICGWRKYGKGKYGSEPFFVPRTTEADVDEDDGYIVSYQHDEIRGTSELLMMDAKSPTLETVSSVKLPTRVPYGFHSIFLNEHELANQDKSPLVSTSA